MRTASDFPHPPRRQPGSINRPATGSHDASPRPAREVGRGSGAMNSPHATGHPSVLCIDDEPSTLAMRKLLLESAGFSVLTAAGGKEGLELFANRHVDAVVVDFSMPEIDGGMIAASIKFQRPRLPVIMVSAFSGARGTVHEIIDAFIEKGSDPNILLQRLESLIRLRSHSHPELDSKYVVFADASRRILDCTEAVCQLLGYSHAEMIEQTIDDISYNSTEVRALFEEYRSARTMDGEFMLKQKNGRPLVIRFHAWAFSDGCMASVWEPVKDWRELYRAAMLEFEPTKLKNRVEVALLAVHQQMRQLGENPPRITEEWVALNDAVNALRVVHRSVIPPSPAPR